jgi:hypothetical protein
VPDEINLTDDWVGEYRQHNRPHPIWATFVQEGDVLVGSMRDGDPDNELLLGEVATGSGEDERIVSRLREMFPDDPAESIRYVSKLPPTSDLAGTVNGRSVYFDKSYQGPCFGGLKVGDKVVGGIYDDHVVHYSGRLSPDGEDIEGRWWIVSELEPGQKLEGPFLLRRWKAGGES